jgi:serine/threonine protein kinase
MCECVLICLFIYVYVAELHCQRLIRRLLEVVSYLHGRGIVHRDLKPENIMVASSADAPHTLTPPSTRTALGGPSESKFDELDGFGQPPTIPEHEYVPRGGADDLEDLENIMVGDFGLSKFATPQELMQQPCGTIAYVAPEVLAKTGYGKEVDLWSVGVITFLCLSGKLPFASKDQETIVALTLAGRVEFDHPAFRSAHPSCVDFIQGLLQIDPAARMDALQALQHPWMHVDLAAGESGSDSARPSLGSPPLSTRTSTSSVGSSLHRMVTVDQQHLKYVSGSVCVCVCVCVCEGEGGTGSIYACRHTCLCVLFPFHSHTLLLLNTHTHTHTHTHTRPGTQGSREAVWNPRTSWWTTRPRCLK